MESTVKNLSSFFSKMYCQFTLIKALRGLKSWKDFRQQSENTIKRNIVKLVSVLLFYRMRERVRVRDRQTDRQTDRQRQTETGGERENVFKERERAKFAPCCISNTGL